MAPPVLRRVRRALMADWARFAWSAAWTLVLAVGPGVLILRCWGLRGPTVWAVAPLITVAVSTLAAVAAAPMGIRWSLPVLLVPVLLLAALGLVGRRVLASRRGSAASTETATGAADGPVRARTRELPVLPRLFPRPWLSLAVIAPAVGIAVMPILVAMGEPGAFLQRWDALYHLQAVQQVRLTGDGSTLHLGRLSLATDLPRYYPGGYHALAALVPFTPTPILLNASVLVLAVVPFVVGSAYLARVLFIRRWWAPTAAAVAAALAPAAPVNEWIHLSPIPNLVAASLLPALLGFAIETWRVLRRRSAGVLSPAVIVRVGALGVAGFGVAFTHPNVAVYAALILGAGAGTDLLTRRDRYLRTWALAWTPPLGLLPYAAVVSGRLGINPGDYVGGLVVPLPQGAGELVSGLLTVWPMPIGVALWIVAWIGLWAMLRRGSFPILVMVLITGVLYIDAAIDWEPQLSGLWYRGQDRISMFLTTLVVTLVPAGLARLQRVLERLPAVTAVVAASAVLLAGVSVQDRADYAALNLDLDDLSRPRYFDSHELAELERVAGEMDPEVMLLASPFSGGSHLHAMTGQKVRFPVAGQTYKKSHKNLVLAAQNAGHDPRACQTLKSHGIGYVYSDAWAYGRAEIFTPLGAVDPAIGQVIMSTDHSVMYKVDCSADG